MKYRLIKWYPSLPDKLKEGDIVTLEVNKYYYFFETIERWEVENYPEFWEKVEEKSYEILSYKYELFFSDTEQSENSVINSIKRLSDGEVFTLGDSIYRNGKVVNIEKIELDKGWAGGVKVNDGIKPHGGECITDLRKADKLFTTNDGVDIYTGDTFYYVNDKWKIYAYTVCRYSSFIPYSCRTAFSTKEKADEWVLLNKYCLSLDDVYNTMKYSSYSDIYHKLKEIVKSRF